MLNELVNRFWLDTDESEQLISSMEYGAVFARDIRKNTQAWKWLIISIDLSAQGACVCALHGLNTSYINNVSCLTKGSGEKWLKWYNEDRHKFPQQEAPKPRLAEPKELLARVCDPVWLPSPHTLIIDDNSKGKMLRLNQLRNNFMHFQPRGFSMNLDHMPSIVKCACAVIEKLVVAHPTPYLGLHLQDYALSRIKEALKGIREGVEAWAASA